MKKDFNMIDNLFKKLVLILILLAVYIVIPSKAYALDQVPISSLAFIVISLTTSPP